MFSSSSNHRKPRSTRRRAIGCAVLVTLLLPAEAGTVITAEHLSTGFSASVACLSNVGPAFGEAGPIGSYAGFHPVAKLILTAAMLIGRLEIVTVLALFHPDVWRHLRWR